LVVDDDMTLGLLDRARSLSAVVGRRVGVRTSEGSLVSGRAIDIAPDGGLTVDVDGDVRTFHVGEIEHLRPTTQA
jgi:BirA family transcriptional regulator, biotin operon repressor / biotin---[acetyl-CoA-carboxylase] ligase